MSNAFVDALRYVFSSYSKVAKVGDEPPARPKTPYEEGRYGKPEEMKGIFYLSDSVRGMRDAVKAGEPANFAAYIDSLPVYQAHLYTSRGEVVLHALGDLTTEQLKTALVMISPEKQKTILDETLMEASGGYKDEAASQVKVLIAAGANVNVEDGMPLRASASRGKTEIVQALYEAGAKFDTAMFGAEVGTKNSGPETVRKLALYNNKLRAEEPDFKPVAVPELSVPVAVVKKAVKKYQPAPLPPF